ncbi:MAG: AarF/ABC1/UbiB kinase family protein [Mycolicibacterium sp.]|uniref:ABC1 kinase family protein n=1 Tax=Mycolicibacterium sp. TaxID=2320850 RepID=UPI000FB0DD76|nr:AarF/ABC1/UbiB kinase family protein [Mycolicibacterium sp.]RUP31873.1 MAG: AarF/ABC1/UbiB kinase family protein [Mycolicibacterium sp.]
MPAKKTRTTRTGRLAQLGGLAGEQAARQLGTRAANAVRTDKVAHAALETRNLEMANRMVRVLGSMRGAAMKVGQMLSLFDAGFIPATHREEFQARLAALHDSAPKLPWAEMAELVEAELGMPIRVAFRRFDTTPVAAASIGQVYRAVMHDGREVAVKVQYPGIDSMVRSDMKNLSFLLKLYGKAVFASLDVPNLADELESRITEELDYEREATNTTRVASALRDHPFIVIPDVVHERSSRRVLTTDWIDGQPLRSVFNATLSTRNRVAESVFRFYAGTPYELGVFSGDPHPGNALVLADGRVAFLDFGLVKEFSPETAEGELTTMRSAIEGDGERLVEVMHERGFVPDPQTIDRHDALDALMEYGWWYLLDQEVEFTPAVASEIIAAFVNPTNRFGRLLLQQNIPGPHAIRIRAELQLVAILGQIQPKLNLHRVAREWIYGEPPVGELGTQHHQWAAPARAAGGSPTQSKVSRPEGPASRRQHGPRRHRQ